MLALFQFHYTSPNNQFQASVLVHIRLYLPNGFSHWNSYAIACVQVQWKHIMESKSPVLFYIATLVLSVVEQKYEKISIWIWIILKKAFNTTNNKYMYYIFDYVWLYGRLGVSQHTVLITVISTTTTINTVLGSRSTELQTGVDLLKIVGQNMEKIQKN